MMPDYNFFVTEGAETQEILIGIRCGHTGFVTQRTEFKAGNPGLRDHMLREALLLRKYLDRAAGGEANYIFYGDLNTMGLDYPYSAHDIAPQDEVAKLSRRAAGPKARNCAERFRIASPRRRS